MTTLHEQIADIEKQLASEEASTTGLSNGQARS
jgi:hypothetical protein